MVMILKIKIGYVYPDLFDLNGDRGNVLAMEKRLLWRNIECEVKRYLINDAIEFSKLDIIYIGAGPTNRQLLACEQLKKQRTDFLEYIKDNGVVTAICSGFQLLGQYFKIEGKLSEGLAFVDMFTESGKNRLSGNVVLRPQLFESVIVGFENHSSMTYIGDNMPLGAVVCGGGNNGQDNTEGIVYKNVIGTNLYGPVLPKNPILCDYILKSALNRRYGECSVEPLDDTIENAAIEYITNRFYAKKGEENVY